MTSGESLNEYGCSDGFSGPDCSIPYEECPDGRRKCLNNSKCVRNNKINPFTNDYHWHCDCSHASTISNYAGLECEHSVTALCQPTSAGTHFCTNGGKCGTFFSEGNKYTGCHCPDDFEGAHCQYLEGEMDGDLFGEVLMEDFGENFYAFKVNSPTNGNATAISFGVLAFTIVAIISIITLAVYKKSKRDEEAKTVMANLHARNDDTLSSEITDNQSLL